MRGGTEEGCDRVVIDAIARKAALVDDAVAALQAGRLERLGPIMDGDRRRDDRQLRRRPRACTYGGVGRRRR